MSLLIDCHTVCSTFLILSCRTPYAIEDGEIRLLVLKYGMPFLIGMCDFPREEIHNLPKDDMERWSVLFQYLFESLMYVGQWFSNSMRTKLQIAYGLNITGIRQSQKYVRGILNCGCLVHHFCATRLHSNPAVYCKVFWKRQIRQILIPVLYCIQSVERCKKNLYSGYAWNGCHRAEGVLCP